MPVGRKLNVDVLEVNLPAFQAMFSRHGTMCEAPGCDPVRPAFAPYQSTWSFSFLCEEHFTYAGSLHDVVKLAWDRTLAEHMLGLLHRQSYTKSNVNSGFVLEAAIAARMETEKELDRLAANRSSQDRRDLRRQISDSATKIGAADENLLTARQRQDKRVVQGGQAVGPKPVDRVALLIPRLVVGVPQHKEE